MVVDTSVLVDALMAGPKTSLARALLGQVADIAAPDLILIETAAALTKAVRRQKIEPSQARELFARARRAGPELEPTNQFLDRAVETSLELNHPVADCVFLVQAQSRADILVTSDGHFARKVAASAYAKFVIELSDWRPQ